MKNVQEKLAASTKYNNANKIDEVAAEESGIFDRDAMEGQDEEKEEQSEQMMYRTQQV